MALLFEVKDRHVVPTVEALLVPPFNEIWERDKSKDKNVAIQEFAYIEFMASYKRTNPYREYPESKKEEIIRKDIIKTEGWEVDDLIKEGIRVLEEFQKDASISYSYYKSAKKAAESMQDFFDNVEIGEKNFKTGNPIYKPKDITSALIDTERVLQNLSSLAKKVEEELFDEVRLKAGKKVSIFANPENFTV
jgi:hypothetical protein